MQGLTHLNAADAGGDAGLGDDFEGADLVGGADVCAPAQLQAHARHPQHLRNVLTGVTGASGCLTNSMTAGWWQERPL